MSRRAAIFAVTVLVVFAVFAIGSTPRTAQPVARTVTVRVPGTYRGESSAQWAAKYRRRTRQLQQAKALTRRRWAPTVAYAIRLASAVTGIPASQLRSVGACESHLYPFARNGRYKGVMQLGWSPFGLSPFDPVANVLSAAMTVRHDGSWRQWSCKP